MTRSALARLSRYAPILSWAPKYGRPLLTDDLVAAAIVTVMLIPQSLAYASIAGVPPEIGLYASIAPLVAYAIFGTSSALAIGPVAVISLMTAATIGDFAQAGTENYVAAAIALAVLVGLILLALGLFRLGFLANFLSTPIISGFVTASGIIIGAGQLPHVFGVEAGGDSLIKIGEGLVRHVGDAHLPTLAIGGVMTIFLIWSRSGLKPLLVKRGLSERAAGLATRAAPLVGIVASIAVVALFHLADRGVAVVGATPVGLPPIRIPDFDWPLWRKLLGPALLIGVIAYVESVSVAQAFAVRRRERIDLDQELVALGACNLASGLSGAIPVAGGFSRSVVNFDAGARTPASGAFAAVGIALAALFLTPLLANLPRATLAATIIVAVLTLIDLKAIPRTFRFSKADGSAMVVTILGVLIFGVEGGVMAGVILSILLLLYRASRPHAAVVGQVPGTEHFRNVLRHQVVTSPAVVSLRLDGDLFFANARFLEDRLLELAAEAPAAKHIVLMCSAINSIDATALEALQSANARLLENGVSLHLSEVKGPVMDRLMRSTILDELSGRVFMSQFDAMRSLDPVLFQQPVRAIESAT